MSSAGCTTGPVGPERRAQDPEGSLMREKNKTKQSKTKQNKTNKNKETKKGKKRKEKYFLKR